MLAYYDKRVQFPYTRAASCYNVKKHLYAMINSNAYRLETYFYSFTKTWKRCYLDFWTHFGFLYSNNVLSKSRWYFFADVFEEFYTIAVIRDPQNFTVVPQRVLNYMKTVFELLKPLVLWIRVLVLSLHTM